MEKDKEHEIMTGGSRGLSKKGVGRQDRQLNTYDWLADLPDNSTACNIVEVQFKPPRKGYFINENNLQLEKGDIVARFETENLQTQIDDLKLSIADGEKTLELALEELEILKSTNAADIKTAQDNLCRFCYSI